MVSTKLKPISPQKRLEIFALYTMAKQHTDKATAFFNALKDALGSENADYMSDLIWGGDFGSFDEALKKEGFVVKAKAKKRRAR